VSDWFRIACVASAISLWWGFAHARMTTNGPDRADARQWTVMTDEFGTIVDYPASIFTADQGSPPRGTGRMLESQDGRARLMVYVERNDAHESPASFIRSNLRVPPSRIDYRRITNRFFAVSGEHEGRIFYSRCNFPDGNNGRLHCIFLSYSQSEKEAWDEIVTRISLSLRPQPGRRRARRPFG
jgi:hypothetical protein